MTASRSIVINLLILFACTCVQAQEGIKQDGKELLIGLLPSFASTDIFSGDSYDYIYRAHIVKFPIARSIKEGKHWRLDIDLVPQFASGTFSMMDNKEVLEDNIEFGASLGLSLHKKFNAWTLHVSGQLGPHYVSDTPEFQSPGFIFSDTVEFGLHYSLGNDFVLRGTFGYRHMSNASLTDKNRGIDNFIYGLGLLKRIKLI